MRHNSQTKIYFGTGFIAAVSICHTLGARPKSTYLDNNSSDWTPRPQIHDFKD